MSGMEDAAFSDALARAKRGDEAAFTALFRMCQPAVLRYLQVVAPDRADDLAGETWLQVVRGLSGFQAEQAAAFRAWVLSIARHRRLDEQRARARRPEALVEAVPERPGGLDVAAAALDLMSTETAVQLIAALPRDQAEVVFLRYVADLDVATTGRLLGKEPGAVRVLAHRGLRKLREIVKKQTEGHRGVTPAGPPTVEGAR